MFHRDGSHRIQDYAAQPLSLMLAGDDSQESREHCGSNLPPALDKALLQKRIPARGFGIADNDLEFGEFGEETFLVKIRHRIVEHKLRPNLRPDFTRRIS